MLLTLLIIVPLLGILGITTGISYKFFDTSLIKKTALLASIINLFISLIIFILFDFSNNQFQFVQEYLEISSFDFYLGLDGLSIYFVLLTTIITPIALLSNWNSINENVRSYVIIILLLETLLLAVFLVLDILLFYIFFESILPPLFILIGLFGSKNKVRASFYFFLYTLIGSLFLLLSILTISSIMGTTDFDGGIALGLAHGFVSSGLFICAGGVLYDRSGTRLISLYRGVAQIMPLFSILFFILCLGIFACSSIVFSAAYTIYMFNRIAFGGYFTFTDKIKTNKSDLNKREFLILLSLVVFTVVLDIYPAPVLDGLHYSVSSLIYNNVFDQVIK